MGRRADVRDRLAAERGGGLVPLRVRPMGVDLPVRMDVGFQRAVGVVSVPVRVLADRPGLRVDLVSVQRVRIRRLRFRLAPVSAPQCLLPARDGPLHPRGRQCPLGAAAARGAVPPGRIRPRRCPARALEPSARPRSGLRSRGTGSPRMARLERRAHRAAGGNPEDARRTAAAGHPHSATGEAVGPPARRCRTEEKRRTSEEGDASPGNRRHGPRRGKTVGRNGAGRAGPVEGGKGGASRSVPAARPPAREQVREPVREPRPRVDRSGGRRPPQKGAGGSCRSGRRRWAVEAPDTGSRGQEIRGNRGGDDGGRGYDRGGDRGGGGGWGTTGVAAVAGR